MKKFLLTLFLAIVGFLGAYSQVTVSTAAYVNGYWTSWEKRNYSWGLDFYPQYERAFQMTMQYNRYDNSFSGLEFTKTGNQPWDWFFKFEVDNYVKPDKKMRKQHQKDKSWYEYSGWVEYYVTDDFPTIKKVLEYYQFPMIQPKGDTARAKRRARATIKIAPYKKTPECFNIYFDGVGVGISFSKWPFDKSYIVK